MQEVLSTGQSVHCNLLVSWCFEPSQPQRITSELVHCNTKNSSTKDQHNKSSAEDLCAKSPQAKNPCKKSSTKDPHKKSSSKWFVQTIPHNRAQSKRSVIEGTSSVQRPPQVSPRGISRKQTRGQLFAICFLRKSTTGLPQPAWLWVVFPLKDLDEKLPQNSTIFSWTCLQQTRQVS